jgi:ParB/RepB/Spo0J family partition protein
MDVRELSIDSLISTRNVRIALGDLSELAESIKEHGVLQPIRVRPAGPGKYQIIAGHRRAAAARIAGLSSIPAVVADESDRGVAIQNVVENLQRENLSPLEIVRNVRELHNAFQLSIDEIARALSKSPARVRTYLRAGILPDGVLERLQSGEGGTQDVRGLTLRHMEPLLSAVSLTDDERASDSYGSVIDAATQMIDEVDRRGVRINAHMADAVARKIREGRMSIADAIDQVLAQPELYRYSPRQVEPEAYFEVDTWGAYSDLQRKAAGLINQLRPEVAVMFGTAERFHLAEGIRPSLEKLRAYVNALEISDEVSVPDGTQAAPQLPSGRPTSD